MIEAGEFNVTAEIEIASRFMAQSRNVVSGVLRLCSSDPEEERKSLHSP
jgi:hypothetical protein